MVNIGRWFKSSRCPSLPKAAPLVYNINSELNTLFFELFSPSPPPEIELLRVRLTVPR
jgi:hypothetical protein